MKRIYNYGGQIEQGFLRIDLGQVPFYQYVSENIDYETFQEEQQDIFKALLIKIAETNQFENITFNDKRLIFLVIKAMIKYPSCLKNFVKGATGMMEFEHVLVYQYLMDNYDKSLTQIDSVIRFINLFIGYSYMSEHKFTRAQADEFNALSDICKEVASDYNGILPSFVLDKFKLNLQIEENETIEDVVDIVEDDIIQEQIEEQVQKEEQGKESEVSEVEEWKLAIESLQMVMDTGDEKEKQEWALAIDTLAQLIELETGKPYQIMKVGGIVQSYVSPALLQFDSGGVVQKFSSPLPQTPAFGGNPKMFRTGGKIGFKGLAKKVAASYKGKKVKPKYQKEYGTTYSASEAKEVGNKIAAKVYRLQQAKKS